MFTQLHLIHIFYTLLTVGPLSLPVTSSGWRHIASKKQHMMDSIHAGTRFEVNCYEKMIHECDYKLHFCAQMS
jgi:hypothetical protein